MKKRAHSGTDSRRIAIPPLPGSQRRHPSSIATAGNNSLCMKTDGAWISLAIAREILPNKIIINRVVSVFPDGFRRPTELGFDRWSSDLPGCRQGDPHNTPFLPRAIFERRSSDQRPFFPGAIKDQQSLDLPGCCQGDPQITLSFPRTICDHQLNITHRQSAVFFL